jgi:hypothetical protein
MAPEAPPGGPGLGLEPLEFPVGRRIALELGASHSESMADILARVGRIDRSNLGSIDFGVVGPKRAARRDPDIANAHHHARRAKAPTPMDVPLST